MKKKRSIIFFEKKNVAFRTIWKIRGKILSGKNSVPELKNGGINSVPSGFGRVKRKFGAKRQRNFWLTFWVDDLMKLNFHQKNSVPRLKTLVKILSRNFRQHFPKVNFPGQSFSLPCKKKKRIKMHGGGPGRWWCICTCCWSTWRPGRRYAPRHWGPAWRVQPSSKS